jgi:hypothetical protein
MTKETWWMLLSWLNNIVEFVLSMKVWFSHNTHADISLIDGPKDRAPPFTNHHFFCSTDASSTKILRVCPLNKMVIILFHLDSLNYKFCQFIRKNPSPRNQKRQSLIKCETLLNRQLIGFCEDELLDS